MVLQRKLTDLTIFNKNHLILLYVILEMDKTENLLTM
ncbi:Uncharacterised protein [Niallia circulans]|jgi:hypothetical protein|nr:Uncharacterised protein [Niallia circulans]